VWNQLSKISVRSTNEFRFITDMDSLDTNKWIGFVKYEARFQLDSKRSLICDLKLKTKARFHLCMDNVQQK
jgi:hypothetical protein